MRAAVSDCKAMDFAHKIWFECHFLTMSSEVRCLSKQQVPYKYVYRKTYNIFNQRFAAILSSFYSFLGSCWKLFSWFDSHQIYVWKCLLITCHQNQWLAFNEYESLWQTYHLILWEKKMFISLKWSRFNTNSESIELNSYNVWKIAISI